jgi:hypothetical protein
LNTKSINTLYKEEKELKTNARHGDGSNKYVKKKKKEKKKTRG